MTDSERAALVLRSRHLTAATLLYNSLEGVVAIGAGAVAGSIALVGFGVDSLIELSASMVALWRLSADPDPVRRELAERRSLRLVGASFLALAMYLVYESGRTLWTRTAPEESDVGIVLAALSLLIMPWLASRKRAIGNRLVSGALVAEATQTQICAWLSAILLAGLALNATLGWWWADPVAALAMVPIIAREGLEGVQGRSSCGDGCR